MRCRLKGRGFYLAKVGALLSCSSFPRVAAGSRQLRQADSFDLVRSRHRLYPRPATAVKVAGTTSENIGRQEVLAAEVMRQPLDNG
jgi:hypothetical protein